MFIFISFVFVRSFLPWPPWTLAQGIQEFSETIRSTKGNAKHIHHILKLIHLTQKSAGAKGQLSNRPIQRHQEVRHQLTRSREKRGYHRSPRPLIIRTDIYCSAVWRAMADCSRRILTADIHQSDSNRINWTFTRVSPSPPPPFLWQLRRCPVCFPSAPLLVRCRFSESHAFVHLCTFLAR